MGPLVPDLVSNNLNFIVALVIGVFFGAILEQAGFSTSKKLVGLFYGYDFTVLRVFFTAGITAMIGIMGLNYYGLIDINLVYVNPTFLWSALVGGVIMGLGFVIGGFCPGTSVCAAAIGKIDAMIFIGGSFIGVLIFAEGYPLFEGLYKSANWGNPRLFETLGISQNIFAFIMVAFALFVFWVTSIIENKVNGIKKATVRLTPYYIGLASIGVLMMISAFIFPDRKASVMQAANDSGYVQSFKVPVMTSDELAYRLIDKQDKQLQILDFRTEKEYTKFNLPKSTLFTIDNLFEKEPNKIISIKHKINLIVANDELTERKIAVIADELGYKRIKILQGGLSGFTGTILNFNNSDSTLATQNPDTYRFRTKAHRLVPVMIMQNKTAGPVKKVQKRVLGGC
ncbi:MAG: YeeE/YedE thiosulfate transporter family protein [Candidatus Kapabacteria bacterium]|jgi:rhodanese-related sulfurtransferase|nr:YeeE/YedE thiosulfate transporter family protein [Candidatus Kapabacteria bacterium]